MSLKLGCPKKSPKLALLIFLFFFFFYFFFFIEPKSGCPKKSSEPVWNEPKVRVSEEINRTGFIKFPFFFFIDLGWLRGCVVIDCFEWGWLARMTR